MDAFVRTIIRICIHTVITFPFVQCIILLLSHPHESYISPCINQLLFALWRLDFNLGVRLFNLHLHQSLLIYVRLQTASNNIHSAVPYKAMYIHSCCGWSQCLIYVRTLECNNTNGAQGQMGHTLSVVWSRGSTVALLDETQEH